MKQQHAFRCKQCGLPVITWMHGWKHASGGANGKAANPHKPVPVTGAEYDEFMQDAIVSMKQALRNRVDLRKTKD